MENQQSFKNERSSLYLVATPIGNLAEMTPRAIEVLNEVDIIACEDTRTSSKLLTHFGIKKKTIAHHLHNEKQSSEGIIKLLADGYDVGLISDAGYPLFSDPGSLLVNKVIEAGYNVIPISGSNACINALVASGIVPQPFTFYGFLDNNPNKRIKTLEQLATHPFTMVFYEAPHRINEMLADLLTVFGDRQICIARELTKKHEEFYRGKISELSRETYKGELVVVVEGYEEKAESLTDEQLISEITSLVSAGDSVKDAIKKIAKQYNLRKNEVYQIYHQNGGQND